MCTYLHNVCHYLSLLLYIGKSFIKIKTGISQCPPFNIFPLAVGILNSTFSSHMYSCCRPSTSVTRMARAISADHLITFTICPQQLVFVITQPSILCVKLLSIRLGRLVNSSLSSLVHSRFSVVSCPSVVFKFRIVRHLAALSGCSHLV